MNKAKALLATALSSRVLGASRPISRVLGTLADGKTLVPGLFSHKDLRARIRRIFVPPPWGVVKWHSPVQTTYDNDAAVIERRGGG